MIMKSSTNAIIIRVNFFKFTAIYSMIFILLIINEFISFPNCGINISNAAGTNRKVSSSISCYTCNSRNETDINCHDPFNPAMSKYVENCKVPKLNHIGVFPARFCVKVVGKTVDTDESLMIRACALESMDNQCGKFKFEGSLYAGCILTCDYDGCNHIDAFVDPTGRFTGNPAAVIVLPRDDYLSDEIKQKIAAEFNLSETVYVSPVDLQSSQWSIRWFTPKAEVKLCGHATVAASYILAKIKNEKNLRYKNEYNEKLGALYHEEDDSIELDFPSNEPQKIEDSEWLQQIKKAIIGDDHLDQIVSIYYSMTTGKLLIRLRDADNDDYLQKIQPNFQRLLQINTNNRIKGVIVTQKPNNLNRIHFWSRYFAPWVGINEDPVTGSAHTVLTPFWSRCYQIECNQTIKEFKAKQSSLRTGILICQLKIDHANNRRVSIKGKARIFCHGEIDLSV
ncbi:phenazine biosynthesis-like protein domain-containing protein-like [Euroglyphus maynei]|uniref:Phenazine biosynthesis-like protein domain-containing protein-like n=1 Tax=Euroglyphus maynei TaxID=6958 RepID=A0A1Y3AVL1_EURMA|nr:phenazine biosynthesis-like protein domain-containing protein-like [Euroglyphus maynei]